MSGAAVKRRRRRRLAKLLPSQSYHSAAASSAFSKRSSSPEMREANICRMYIGLYLFFGLLTCVPMFIVGLMTLPGLWSSMFDTVSELLTRGTLPGYNHRIFLQ